MDVDKIIIADDEEEFPAIARLIELGRQKSYVTLDDILHFFPEAEQDVEQLEEAFSALLSTGIPFVEDTTPGEPTEDELVAVEETEVEPDISLDDYLANIDTDDTIGLYLKKSAVFRFLPQKRKFNSRSASSADERRVKSSPKAMPLLAAAPIFAN